MSDATTTEVAAGAAARWRREAERLRAGGRDAVPDVLGPPEVFSDTVGCARERARYGLATRNNESGPDSRTVTSRLRMSCAGWEVVPTAREFYEAIHRARGTDRETAILLTCFAHR